jgi:hypothetical protein
MSLTFCDIFCDWKDHRFPPQTKSAHLLQHVKQYQGKMQEARELLARVYGWFTERFDTRDLKEAKALLDALAV